MKSFSIIGLVIIMAFLSCHDEGLYPDGYDHPCDYMLGSFAYLQTSLERIPYREKEKVIFIDTFGNALSFSIRSIPAPKDKHAIVYNWPDMTKTYYCYESIGQSFILDADASDEQFTVTLMAIPFFSDPLLNYVADNISILGSDTYDGQQKLGFFSKYIDKRTFPEWKINAQLDTFTCFGRIFTDVEHELALFGAPVIFYNDTEGIVAFIDASGKKWCFDRFEG